MFTRESIKPVLVSILSQPEVLDGNYDFFEDDPDNQEIFEEKNESMHIAKGEPGYEKRVQEVIDDNLFYLIGDESMPNNRIVDYLNENLQFVPVMRFPTEEVFQFIRNEMVEYVKDGLFLEDKECDLEIKIDYDNPPDFLNDVFPVDKFDNTKFLDTQHKYVFIDRESCDDFVSFDWGTYICINHLSLRDDCKLCWIIEHRFEIENNENPIVCNIYEMSKREGEYSEGFLMDIVNGDI